MGFTLRGGPEAQQQAPPAVYCVVPPNLAAMEARLREHFAHDPAVEVVVDRRFAERRSTAGRDPRTSSDPERRETDGRRAASAAPAGASLPAALRHLERRLEFRAVDDRGWRDRCLEAEEQAERLIAALEHAAAALRSRGGLSPRRYLELARIERAIGRYYGWRRLRT